MQTDPKTYPAHQQNKIGKLSTFIEESPIFDSLPNGEPFRLRLQLSAMELYLQILLERIGSF